MRENNWYSNKKNYLVKKYLHESTEKKIAIQDSNLLLSAYKNVNKCGKNKRTLKVKI